MRMGFSIHWCSCTFIFFFVFVLLRDAWAKGEFGLAFSCKNRAFSNENADCQSFGTVFSKLCNFKLHGIRPEATPLRF